MRKTRVAAAALAAAGLLLLGLTGCATDRPGSGVDATPNDPTDSSASDPDDGAPGDPTPTIAAAWLGNAPVIALVTWGSSSCAPFVDGISGKDGRIEVVLATYQEACTDDLVPRTLTVMPPEGIDVTQPVEIVLKNAMEGSTELPGFTGEKVDDPFGEMEPAAAWTNVPGVAVVLTYGSSSCPPIVESIEGATDGVLQVQFVEPSADQVCTADMAPRITAIDTRGVENVDPATTTTLVVRSGESSFDLAIAPPA